MNAAGIPDVDAVVVGASAGGVEALQRLLAAVPAGFAPAILIVLHAPADGLGGLVPLLAQRCALPVQEALDKQPVAGGNVYFAPANYHLLIESELTLALSVDAPVVFSRPAIDPLFESAAAVFGGRLLALLLTGASSDGSEGVAAVRRHGGIVWVQDPADAFAPTMPAAALARAGADEVLSMDQICLRFSSPGQP